MSNSKKIYTFARVENKYLLTAKQFESIENIFSNYMKLDEYGKTRICNLYYDTVNFELARLSLDKPTYKEKLRLRSYNVPTLESEVFLEIKKKYDGVVYKRRINGALKEIDDNIGKSELLERKNQITNEIKYLLNHYDLYPQACINYDRCAYYGNIDQSFRITLDTNIVGRDYNLDLSLGDYGDQIIEDDLILMEVKCDNTLPLWFVRMLSINNIYPTSFSKYGTYYKNHLINKVRRNFECSQVY